MDKLSYGTLSIFLLITAAFLMSGSKFVSNNWTNYVFIFASNTVATATIIIVLNLRENTLNAIERRLKTTVGVIIVRCAGFLISATVFYFTFHIGIQAGMLNLKSHTESMFDIQIGAPWKLAFVDVYTIGSTYVYSAFALCFGRMARNTRLIYNLHELLLDLTLHLAFEYAQDRWFDVVVVLLACLFLIVLKELSEPKQAVNQGPANRGSTAGTGGNNGGGNGGGGNGGDSYQVSLAMDRQGGAPAISGVSTSAAGATDA